eukprot:CAMPEP_0201595922 /NCGR_PEP_ID=MMETSP0190_2-20130828/192763_1 /ASSEMBLY_ACC=CAM_ASM_000263 /TAXON_ID=37353 /ORGANISM="Rosalina sp." /LENGTH=68 /DNA_ID=CAMNT_0048056069 /DNA_START=772 /DNA_END=978 /DNA_ORIENTATION=+
MKLLTKKDEDRISLNDIEKHKWYDGYIHPEYVMEEDDEEENDPNNKEQNEFDQDMYAVSGTGDCCVVV